MRLMAQRVELRMTPRMALRMARKDGPLHKGSAARTYWLRGYDAAKRATIANPTGATS